MTKDNIELAYKSAISLIAFEGTLLWSRFGVMLTINTILLSLAGLLIGNKGFETEFLPLFVLLSVLGLLFSILWWQMTGRGFAVLTYYTLAAREAEDQLGDEVNIFSRGNRFRQDMTVEFKLKDKTDPNKNFQRPLHTRFIRTENAAYFTIGLVSLVYIVLLFISVVLFCINH